MTVQKRSYQNAELVYLFFVAIDILQSEDDLNDEKMQQETLKPTRANKITKIKQP